MAKNRRSERGNMLILITAFTVIVLALLFFALGYVRLVGSSSEQKTAIEAAAIAAARDISTIVLETPEFGWVGLSDSAPIGHATEAGDDYYVPVHSINTLIGTARLDHLIANQVGVDTWRELAEADLVKAKAVSARLITEIRNSIASSASFGRNKNGQQVFPFRSAEAAYRDNLVRMTGGGTYVPNSLRLELGEVEGITCTPVPNPVGVDTTLNTSNSISGCYKSYVNVPIGDQDYVFAGIGNSIKLVDYKKWVPAIASLPYHYPTIIRAEAKQVVHQATTGDATLLSVACAQPASVYDPRPYPGALTLSFPDGVPDGGDDGVQKIEKPLDLYSSILSDPQDTCDYLSATPGDYPSTSGSQCLPTPGAWPLPGPILASSACKLAVYDWIRRAGTKADVDSIVGMHNTIFIPQGPDVMWPPMIPGHPPPPRQHPIPAGIMHIYKFDTDGVIDYEAKELKPFPYWVISDQQNLAECYDALTRGAREFTVQPVPLTIIPGVMIPLGAVEFTGRYDMYVRIYSRKYGKPGGMHEGEPMDNGLLTMNKMRIISDGNVGKATKLRLFHGRGARGKSPPLIGSGIGAIPTLMPQEDFRFKWNIIDIAGPDVDRDGEHYEKFDGSGPGMRPTYAENGSVADIRFRRVLIGRDPVSGVINLLGTVLPIQKQQGYVGPK